MRVAVIQASASIASKSALNPSEPWETLARLMMWCGSSPSTLGPHLLMAPILMLLSLVAALVEHRLLDIWQWKGSVCFSSKKKYGLATKSAAMLLAENR
jgi:hypothetical protein